MKRSMELERRKRLPIVVLAALVALGVAVATSTASSAAPKLHVTIKTGFYPSDVIAAYGSIWVATHRDVYLYRINPKTNRAVRIDVSSGICWLDASGGAIWASVCGDPPYHYMRIDVKTNKPGQEIPGSDPYLDAGSLWVLDQNSTNLLRLDPTTHVVVKSIPISFSDVTMGGVEGVGYGSVWAGDQQTVWRVEEATNTVTVIPLPGVRPPSPSQGFAGSAEMAFAYGKAWYGSPVGLYEIDAKTNKVKLLPIKIGDFANLGDIAVVAALGSIWIRTSGSSIARVNPVTGKVVARYPASGGGGWFTVANGSIWVANADDNTVWRLPVH